MIMDNISKWTEDLTVGIDEIDNQHKELFRAANKLFDAAKSGKDLKEIEGVFAFLEGYVLDHFGLEEEYMDKFHYSDSALHKAKHKDFLVEFLKLKSELKRTDAPNYLSLVIEGWLYKWLNNHFGNEDRALGKFLKHRI